MRSLRGPRTLQAALEAYDKHLGAARHEWRQRRKLRFAARARGPAVGLALAVRPAGLAPGSTRWCWRLGRAAFRSAESRMTGDRGGGLSSYRRAVTNADWDVHWKRFGLR